MQGTVRESQLRALCRGSARVLLPPSCLTASACCAGFARYMANKLGAMSKLDAVPPVMARGEPATFYGDGNTPCAVPCEAEWQASEPVAWLLACMPWESPASLCADTPRALDTGQTPPASSSSKSSRGGRMWRLRSALEALVAGGCCCGMSSSCRWAHVLCHSIMLFMHESAAC